jgi:hypothetical protein
MKGKSIKKHPKFQINYIREELKAIIAKIRKNTHSIIEQIVNPPAYNPLDTIFYYELIGYDTERNYISVRCKSIKEAIDIVNTTSRPMKFLLRSINQNVNGIIHLN